MRNKFAAISLNEIQGNSCAHFVANYHAGEGLDAGFGEVLYEGITYPVRISANQVRGSRIQRYITTIGGDGGNRRIAIALPPEPSVLTLVVIPVTLSLMNASPTPFVSPPTRLEDSE